MHTMSYLLYLAVMPTDVVVTVCRRLVEKLGLDIQQQQAQQQDVVVQEGAGDVGIDAAAGVEVNQDLLSLVQEFYDEKAAEEERLEQLKKRSTTSYFPPSFRQSKDLSQSSDAASQGEFRYLLDTDWFDDDVSETGSVDSPMRQLQLLQQQAEGAVDVPILRKHSNSMVGASFARGSFDAFTPEMSSKFTRRNSTKSLQELPQFTNDEILAAVAAVVGTVNASRGAQQHHLKAPSGDSSASGVPELVVGAPVRRLSTRMERMLSRRGSFNPAEVRLELLDSLHDNVSSVLVQSCLFLCDEWALLVFNCAPTAVDTFYLLLPLLLPYVGGERAGARAGQRSEGGAQVPAGQRGECYYHPPP